MIKKVDKFLKENFEISLETYLRLTDIKLKKLLQSEIRNFLENQEDKQIEKLLKLTKEQLEQKRVDKELFDLILPMFNSMSRIGQVTTLETLLIYLDLEKEE